jgi:DNA-binding response OmpR family regulator
MVREKPFVLVLEDDPVSAEALMMVLRDWGAEVVHAAHANHVRHALGARASELHSIIADYDLGDGPNGVVIAADLLADAQRARVLVLSGTLRARSDVAARNAGFDMMQKPARADAIVAWLETA